jgi:hypothetical protein
LDLFGIPGSVIVQGGAAGILAFVVLAVLLGKLHPDRTLDRIEKVHEKQLANEKARGDEWRARGDAQEQRNDILAQQLAELLEVGRTTNALIEGLRKANEQRASRRP